MSEPHTPSIPGVLVGCCGFGGPVQPYVRRLPLVEYQQTFISAPRPGVLRRLREAAPEDFVFAVKASQLVTHPPDTPGYRRLPRPPEGNINHYGMFRPTDEVARAWEATLAAARLLRARAVVFETPPAFTPTVVHRDWLRRFFGAMPRDADTWMAWEPRGLWQPGEIAALCDELGLVPVTDPLADDALLPAPGAPAYLKVRALGSPGGPDRSTLSWLAEDLASLDQVLCVLHTPNQFRDAQHLWETLEHLRDRGTPWDEEDADRDGWDDDDIDDEIDDDDIDDDDIDDDDIDAVDDHQGDPPGGA